MYDEEIEKFKQQFYAEGKVRRRKKKSSKPQDFEDRRRKKNQDEQRRSARDHDRREPPRDSDVIARNEAALRQEQEARVAKLASMNIEISNLADTQITVRHKAPSGLPTAQLLIDKWKELETQGKAASPDSDDDLEELSGEIDDFKRWLDHLDEMFTASTEAEALYDYAVRKRPIRIWPEVESAAKDMADAVAWPIPNKAKFINGLSAIIGAKLVYEAAQTNLAAIAGAWQTARAKLQEVKVKLNSQLLRVSSTPAIDGDMANLDRVFNTPLTAELLDPLVPARLSADIARLDNWATTVGAKVDGQFFQFLELGRSARQGKRESKPWDFEKELEYLLFLLTSTPNVTGAQIDAGFKSMLDKFGPWTAMQEYAQAQAAAAAERAQLSQHFQNVWGFPVLQADKHAEAYYAINPRARLAFTRNPLTWANYQIIEFQMGKDGPALAYLLGLPGGSDTARLAGCLNTREINANNVWDRFQSGDVRIDYNIFFEYKGTIEVELKVSWTVAGMPGIPEWCVIHMHYYGTTANAAGFNFAHLKEWTARQAQNSSSGPAGTDLSAHARGIVHPMNLSL